MKKIVPATTMRNISARLWKKRKLISLRANKRIIRIMKDDISKTLFTLNPVIPDVSSLGVSFVTRASVP